MRRALLNGKARTETAGPLPPFVDPEPSTVPYAHRGTPPFNAPVYMVTPTETSDGATVHPSVKDFGPGNTWNGHRYWMAITDYGNDGLEDPHIMVSEDGFNWSWPVGINNPVWDRTTQAPFGPGDLMGLNSDTELVHDPTTNKLHLWWREYGGIADRIWHSESSNGVTWANPSVQIESPSAYLLISPAVVRVAQGQWRMWTYEATSPPRIATRTATSPAGPWSAPVATTAGTPWHFGVTYANGKFYGVGCTGSATGVNARIWTLTSTNGVAWTISPTSLLRPQAGRWDNQNLYRTSLQIHPDGEHMRIWYSAESNLIVDGTSLNWRTGYTVVPLSYWPSP